MRSEQGSSSQQQMKTMRGERYNGVWVPEKEQVRSDEESCGEGPRTLIIHEVHNSPFEWHGSILFQPYHVLLQPYILAVRHFALLKCLVFLKMPLVICCAHDEILSLIESPPHFLVIQFVPFSFAFVSIVSNSFL